MKYLLLLLFTGCVVLPHVEPAYRDANDQKRTVVKVQAFCGTNIDDETHTGTGVVISERHILTAQHVVRCAVIPTVYVTLYNGERHKVVVTHENTTEDIARLEIFHAGRFELNVPPPKLSYWRDIVEYVNDWVCVWPATRRSECYKRIDLDLVAGRMYHGDSGAPVYDYGVLVGLVIRDVPSLGATRISLVDDKWLEGT